MQHEFFTILQERNREGATVFLSSHILSEIQRYCSRAAVIRDGRIIACDSVDQLVKSGTRRISLRGSLRRQDVPGARSWKADGDTRSFLYNGDINELIRILAGTHVEELTVAEPDLEEIVLHYYEQDNEKEGEQA